MKDLTHEINKSIRELNEGLQTIDYFLKSAPEGSLREAPKPRKNKTYFYLQIYRNDKKIYKYKYLNKGMAELRDKLAKKKYYLMLREAIVDELTAFEAFKKTYHPHKKYLAFQSMSEARKKLVVPLFAPPEHKYAQWKGSDWKQYDGYPEYLRYETNRGEKVRSKSEVIIANILYEYRDILDYHYEEELVLNAAGQIVHPDFTIIVKATGRIWYWEHAGRIDDPRYGNDFVRKINSYISNGFYPGESLLISYESSEFPLDISLVRSTIYKYFM